MTDQISIQFFKTPFGELILGSYENKLCLTDWRYRKMRTTVDLRIKKELNAEFIEQDSEIIKQTIKQLNEYFAGNRKAFDIPLIFAGSGFQKKVWTKLLEIPFGKTESYSGLSKRLGDIKAIRAVASANGANAISIIVPCHRILGSKGELTGYAGGLQIKKKLLDLEGYTVNGQGKLSF